MTDIAIVDDRNLGRLIFTGTWVNAGAAPFEWNGTTHGSQTTGSQVTFQFNATEVEVYGTVGAIYNSGLPISTYELDSATALTYIAANVSATTYQNQFYKSPLLPDGPHTLVITLTSQGAMYWLDYLLYTPSSNTLSACPVCTSPSPSSVALLATSPVGSTTTSSMPLASKTSSPSSSQPFPVRALAGALVGGLVLLALLTAGLFFYLKRKGTSTEERETSRLPDTRISPSPTSAAHSSMAHLISSNNAELTPEGVHTTAGQRSIFTNPAASSHTPSNQTQCLRRPSGHGDDALQLELQEGSDLTPMSLPPAYQRDYSYY